MSIDQSSARKIAILGAGAWGQALAHCALRNQHDVKIWVRDKSKYPDKPYISDNLHEVCDDSEMILHVLPSFCFMDMIQQLPDDKPIIQCAKGIGWINEHPILFSEYAQQIQHKKPYQYALLSGPNFAYEIMNDLPAIATVASHDDAIIHYVKAILQHKLLRLYAHHDVVGCEILGTAKNIVAIACGIAMGAGFGENARAALFTRAHHELQQLLLAYGGDSSTMMSAAGIGDMALTAFSATSRNTKLGIAIGKAGYYQNNDDIFSEGQYNVKPLYYMAKNKNIDSPIINAVYDILYRQKPVLTIVNNLLERSNLYYHS